MPQLTRCFPGVGRELVRRGSLIPHHNTNVVVSKRFFNSINVPCLKPARGFNNNNNYNTNRDFNNNNSYKNNRGPRRDNNSRYNNRGKKYPDNRYSRDSKRHGGGYRHNVQESPDLKRNSTKREGPEGDGLRGQDDYRVDLENLRSMEWSDMVQKASDEENSAGQGFSNVPTLALSDHKVVSRVLVNSLRYHREYTKLTPVQAQTILPIMQNNSMVVRAKTGTGKTAAFSVPTIHKVLEAKQNKVEGVKAVIISPTRELAQQISDEITQIISYGQLRQIRVGCYVGGLSKEAQIKNGFGNDGNRSRVDIVVATPGRLLDLLHEERVIKHFDNVSIKVLDEADRLLEIGFKETLHDIDRKMKSVHHKEFQTLLFSATTDKNMMNFAKRELDENVKIVDTVPKNEPQAQELVTQHAVECSGWADIYNSAVQNVHDGIESTNGPYKAIIFLPTVGLVKHFGELLKLYVKSNFHKKGSVSVIHGQLTQGQRQRAADKFKESENGVLVTTDVVARGMDFPNVTHVLQLGTGGGEVASYIHRIGRTARIGHSGQSYLYMTPVERPFLKLLKKERNIELGKAEHSNPDNAVMDSVTEIAEDLQTSLDDLPEDILNSLFSSYMGPKKIYGFRGYDFAMEQEPFATLVGADLSQLRPQLKASFLRRSPSYGNNNNRRPNRANNGRRGKNFFR